MADKVTLCIECDNVADHSRKSPQYQWLCLMFPRAQGGSFLDPEWLQDAPFNRCVNVNLGHCPVFTPRRKTES